MVAMDHYEGHHEEVEKMQNHSDTTMYKMPIPLFQANGVLTKYKFRCVHTFVFFSEVCLFFDVMAHLRW